MVSHFSNTCLFFQLSDDSGLVRVRESSCQAAGMFVLSGVRVVS